VYQTLSDLLVKTSGLKQDDKQFIEKGKKTLMLLHGWGMNSHVWEPIREALESQYRVIWIDLPGHGINQQLEAKSLEHIVELVSDVIPEKTHIMGWSLGGMIAQTLAQKIPDKIISLTLVTSTPRFSQSKQGDWEHAMSDDVLNRFADNLKQDAVKTIKGFIALQFLGVKDSKQAQDELINHILNNGKTPKKWGGVFSTNSTHRFLDDSIHDSELNNQQSNNIPTQEALDVGLSILHNTDLRSTKPTCPEHWLFGEYDRLIPKQVINDLKSLRPDAQITLLEKAGHAPFITHTETFIEQVNQFIEAQS